MKTIYQFILFASILIVLGASCKGDKACKGILDIQVETECDGDLITINDKSSPICKIKQIGWVAVSGYNAMSNPELIQYSPLGTPITLSKTDIPEGYNLFYIIEKTDGDFGTSQLDVCLDKDESFVYSDEEEYIDEEEDVEEEPVRVADNKGKASTPEAKSAQKSSSQSKSSTSNAPSRPADADEDGVPDSKDNCRTTFNPDQKDSDNDGKGDKCDSTPFPPKKEIKKPSTPKVADADKDGIPDSRDNCRTAYNPDQKDSDNDGKGDECDSTPFPPKKEIKKPSTPKVADADKDGIPDSRDNCRTAYNPDQKDSDNDGKGDECDSSPFPPKKTAPPPPSSSSSDEEPDFLNKAYAGNRLRKKCASATEVTSLVSVTISPKQNFEIMNAKVVSKGYGDLTVNLKQGGRTIKSYSGLSLIPGKREIGFSGLYEYLEKGKTYTLELIPNGTALMSMAACEEANFSDMRVNIDQPSDGVVLFDLFINY